MASPRRIFRSSLKKKRKGKGGEREKRSGEAAAERSYPSRGDCSWGQQGRHPDPKIFLKPPNPPQPAPRPRVPGLWCHSDGCHRSPRPRCDSAAAPRAAVSSHRVAMPAVTSGRSAPQPPVLGCGTRGDTRRSAATKAPGTERGVPQGFVPAVTVSAMCVGVALLGTARSALLPPAATARVGHSAMRAWGWEELG